MFFVLFCYVVFKSSCSSCIKSPAEQFYDNFWILGKLQMSCLELSSFPPIHNEVYCKIETKWLGTVAQGCTSVFLPCVYAYSQEPHDPPDIASYLTLILLQGQCTMLDIIIKVDRCTRNSSMDDNSYIYFITSDPVCSAGNHNNNHTFAIQ